MTITANQLGLLEQAARLTEQSGGAPMAAARLAEQEGLPNLARALLARTGGLFDSAEAGRLLQPDRSPRLPGVPTFHSGQEEMAVRALAAALLSGPSGSAASVGMRALPTQTGSGSATPALLPKGLSMIEAGSGPQRWQTALARALESAQAAGGQHVTLACASWGAQQDALMTLRAHYGSLVGGEDAVITILSLEEVVKLVSAAWAWDLPQLARLMSGPVLLEGLYSLSANVMGAVLPMLRDAAWAFGVPVAGLHGQDYPWTAEFDFIEPRSGPPDKVAAQVGCVLEPLTLSRLAAQLHTGSTDALVVLSSRASAARMVSLWPGSELLSSSLCPLHLADRVAQLKQRREAGETLRVVATVLPPQALGQFGTVWHVTAPLPHLAEAQALCSGTMHVTDFSDVAPQTTWARECAVTAQLLDSGKEPGQHETQREYYQRLAPGDSALSAVLNKHRAELNYASLAADLVVRSGGSVPVFIDYDAQAAPLLESIRRSRVFEQSALRYAAWLTPSEAERAVKRGQAHSLGWALIWDAPYDRQFGLAAEAVRASQVER